MKSPLQGLPVGFRVSVPLVASAAAVALAAMVVGGGLTQTVKAVFASGVSEDETDPFADLGSESDALFETSRKRYDGRSMYALPTPPVRRPPPPPPRPPEPPKPPPGPPPAPASYTGPAPTAIVGDFVYFGALRVKLGEERDGIKVVSIDAPYSIKVEHMRGNYTVPFWSRIDARLLRGATAMGSVPGIVESAAGAGAVDRPPVGGDPEDNGAAEGPEGSPLGELQDIRRGGSTPRAPGSPSGPGAGGGDGNPVPAGGQGGQGQGGQGQGGQGQGGQGQGGQGQGGQGGGGTDPNGNPVSGPVPGSGDLPSPAMQPQRLPRPGSAPSNEPASEGAGIEYVDRALLPQPLTDAQIAAMTEEQARMALQAIDNTNSWNVDGHSRARLDHEREQLLLRINGNPST
jgi:hypothetical protein